MRARCKKQSSLSQTKLSLGRFGKFLVLEPVLETYERKGEGGERGERKERKKKRKKEKKRKDFV